MHNRPAVINQAVPVLHQAAQRFQEQFLYPLLIQMGRRAFMFSFKLGVALPDCALIFAVGMPHLRAEVCPAVPAFQLGGKRAAAIAPSRRPPALHLQLYQLPLGRGNDGVMAALHIILRHFTFIRFPFLREEIHRVALLQTGIAFVFFVGQDIFHRPMTPLAFPGRRGNLLLCQILCNGIRRFPLHEHPVNQPYGFRLLRHNLHLPVLAFLVSEEGAVRKADFAVCKTLSLSPGNILRDGAGFLLRKAAHDGNQQLAFGVKCKNVLFLEINLHASFLQLPHCREAVHRIPCEPGY